MKKILIAFLFISGCGHVSDSEVKLIGAQTSAIPQVIKLSGGTCTGAVVGSSSILTAAHCFKTGSSTYFYYMGKKYNAKCVRNPDYKSWFGVKNDHALCRTTENMPKPHVKIDMVNPVQYGEVVQLTGYGCYNSKKQHDGKQRSGYAQVNGGNATEFTTLAGNGFTSALCSGDSGGPVLRKGRVVGVNSRANMSDYSILDRTATVSFQKFAASWKNW